MALGIQHPMRIYHIVICGLHCCTIFFHIISKTVQFSEKKNIEHEMCVLISLQRLCGAFLILRRTERDMTKTVCCSSRKAAVILVRF